MGTPHDALFKLAFEDPRHTGPLLASLLPSDSAAQIDWSTMRRERGSGTNAALEQRHSDLVFSVGVIGRRERLYTVVEHKSYSKPGALTQLFGYVCQAVLKFQDTESKHLPQVVCVLVHHGPPRWRQGTNILAATSMSPGLWSNPAEFLTSIPILVDDLTCVSVEELRVRDLPVVPKLALLFLKRARPSEDFLAELREWIDELRALAVTIPNRPSLMGLSIHAQALLVQLPGSARLTNVTVDPIVR